VPIEVKCPQCSRKFRIPDKYSGKRVKCPGCQGAIAVPSSGPKSPAPAIPKVPGQEKGPQRPAPAKQPEWYMQTEDGEQYGPVSKEELQGWIAEGRIDASCQVLQDGWEQWKWAEDVFPQIGQTASDSSEVVVPGDENPFAGPGQSESPAAAVAFDSAPPDAAGAIVSEQPAAAGEISPQIIAAMAQTRPWVNLVSILWMVFVGLGTLVQLAGMALGGIVGIAGGLPGLAIMGLYFYTAYLLFSYGQKIQIFLRRKGTVEFQKALDAQRVFWKTVGIIMLVSLVLAVLMVILIVILVIAGAAALSSMGQPDMSGF